MALQSQCPANVHAERPKTAMRPHDQRRGCTRETFDKASLYCVEARLTKVLEVAPRRDPGRANNPDLKCQASPLVIGCGQLAPEQE